MISIALIATLFTLFMSNVATTVLLVPIVMIIGTTTGINARALALLVAVCASNSFLLPTHQVNAFLMSPGGYRNADYLRAGIPLTFIFIFIVTAIIYLIYI
jgi:di/tricarboxylate transporter